MNGINKMETEDKYPVIERSLWIGRKDKLLKKFEEASLSKYKGIQKNDPMNVKEQLDLIELTGMPGLLFWIKETIEEMSKEKFPTEIKAEMKSQWVHVDDLEITHFAGKL